MKWRGINSLTYLTCSSVRGVFGRPLPGFRKVRSIADPRSSTRLQIAFTGKVSNPFSGILQQFSNAGGVRRNRDSEPISGLTACVNAATGRCCKRGRRWTATVSQIVTHRW